MSRFWLVLSVALVLLAGSMGQAAEREEGELLELLTRTPMVIEDGRRFAQVSLKDLLQLGIRRSLVLRAAKMGEEIALHSLTAAQHDNNPVLKNSVEYDRAVSASFTNSSAQNDFLSLVGRNTVTLSSALTKKVSSGIEYGLTFSELRTQAEAFTVANAGDEPASSGSFSAISASALTGSVSIPFAKDAGSEFNDISIRQGETGLRRSRWVSRQNEMSVITNIAATYWDMVGFLEAIKVQEEAVKLSEQLLSDNRLRLESGVLSPADVKVSESLLARERQNLLTTQLDALRIEDQLRTALNMAEVEIGFRPKDTPLVRDMALSLPELLKKVFRTDPSLALLRTQLEDNNADLIVERNEDKTDLSLDLNYVLNGYGNQAIAGVSNFSQTQTHGYNALVTWTVPLFDQQTQENIQRRILERAQLEVQIDNVRSGLTVRAQSILRSLRLARTEVNTAQVSVDLQRELLQNEIERFKLGRSTSFRVAQFQQDLALARQREILARVGFEKTLLALLVLSGDVYTEFDLTSQTSPP